MPEQIDTEIHFYHVWTIKDWNNLEIGNLDNVKTFKNYLWVFLINQSINNK